MAATSNTTITSTAAGHRSWQLDVSYDSNSNVYYEVSTSGCDHESYISVGFAPAQFPSTELPGEIAGSCAYRYNFSSLVRLGSVTVGCGFRSGVVYFSLDGEIVESTKYEPRTPFLPTFGLHGVGTISWNNGFQPFRLQRGINPKGNPRVLTLGPLVIFVSGKNNSVQSDLKVAGAASLYFEMEILEIGPNNAPAIGFATSLSSDRLPGWDSNSHGLHGDDGNYFCALESRPISKPFGAGSTVGCGIDCGKIYFTLNGTLLGRGKYTLAPGLFYRPVVAADAPAQIHVNFGERPFCYQPPRITQCATDNDDMFGALPDELLLEVLNMAIRDSAFNAKQLASVCKRWHTMVLSNECNDAWHRIALAWFPQLRVIPMERCNWFYYVQRRLKLHFGTAFAFKRPHIIIGCDERHENTICPALQDLAGRKARCQTCSRNIRPVTTERQLSSEVQMKRRVVYDPDYRAVPFPRYSRTMMLRMHHSTSGKLFSEDLF